MKRSRPVADIFQDANRMLTWALFSHLFGSKFLPGTKTILIGLVYNRYNRQPQNGYTM